MRSLPKGKPLPTALDPECSHIINGHVPVKSKSGESPIKANGKLIVIDGGFSRAYQSTTGIAGYTLIYNSYGLLLISHDPFESTQKAIEEEKDIHSTTMVLEKEVERKRVKDTDEGIVMKAKIKDLEMLLDAYRLGLIKEQE
jgi:fructose-1,6-bisphosphatase-3